MLSSIGSRVSAQAIVVAIGLICGAHAAGAGSLPPDQFDRSLASMDSARTSEEPFGLLTMALPEKPRPGKKDGRRARYRRGHENRGALPIRSRALPVCGGPAFSLDYR